MKGGAERQLYYLIKGLPKTYDVQVCAFVDGYYGQKLRKEGYKVKILDKGWSGVQQFLNLVREYKPHVVHSWMTHANIFCKFCRFFVDYRMLVCSIRGKENTFRHKIEAFIERALDFKSDKVVTNSNSFARGLKKGLFYRKKKVSVVYNGFVPETAKMGAVKKSLNLKDSRIVTVIANFRPGKDYPGAIKVAKEVFSKRSDTVFLFVGDGERREKIEQMVKDEGLEDRILLLGTRSDIPNILVDSDVFFLPTLYEAQSNVLIEAMFYMCPIVTTDIPENAELIRDGKEGHLVKIGDYKEMAERICEVLDNRIEASVIRSNAYRKANSTFGLQKMVNGYLDIYGRKR
ncbi:MAG: glycosyltransferase [Candidatus Aenigmarchaeota archaeon]|nr:glycosyltransferase [Candidatus Aenigmarchaeota archaeon]